jgi:hypothetical protein
MRQCVETCLAPYFAFIQQLGRLVVTSALVVACVAPRTVDGDSAPVSTHGTLRVEVVSLPTGAPLPDLIVRLEARHDGIGQPMRAVNIDRARVRAHALTDSDGCVQFALHPGIDLWVRVVGDFGQQHVRPVAALRPGEATTVRFELPIPELDTLRGKVVCDQVATPVEGARVAWLDDRLTVHQLDGLLEPPRRPVLAATFTGSDGHFELSVPVAIEGRLTLEAIGYQPLLVELSSPNTAGAMQGDPGSAPLASSEPAAQTTDAELVLALEPCDQRAIMVVDDQSRPLSGIDVIVEAHWSRIGMFRQPGDPHCAEPDYIATARTGPDGVCWFPERLVGNFFTIDAVSADGTWLGAHRSDISGKTLWPDPRRPFVWRLAELQTIEGRARFEDGSPAAGVVLGLGERQPKQTVILYQLYQNPTFVAQTRTAADGTFRFDAVRRPRPHLSWMIEPRPRPLDRLQIQDDALAPTRALVEYGEDGPPLPLDIELCAARYVTGHVSDSAGRLANKGLVGLSALDASVDDSTTCDPDGAFLVGPLAPGRYELRALLDSDGEPRGPCKVVIDTLDTTVTLQPDERHELVVQ